MNLTTKIMAGVIIFLLATCATLKYNSNKYYNQVVSLTAALEVEKANNNTLRAGIDSQNNSILLNKKIGDNFQSYLDDIRLDIDEGYKFISIEDADNKTAEDLIKWLKNNSSQF